MPGPLASIRVIELGGIGPVPHAGMMLADMGAEVVQVVRPGGEALGSGILSRGKRSIALDLKDPAATAAILRLVEEAHILIEGFRPGVAERLGLGPDTCHEVNPSLVYGRMTGWGQDGPLAGSAGHDIDYIAVAGALNAIGPPAHPVPPLNLVGDFGGGSMLLVMGVLAALNQRERTGRGEVVDAAMVDGAALLMAMHHGAMAEGWWTGERGSDLFDGSAPFYTTYATSDGRWMAVGALEPEFYAHLVDGLGLREEDLPDQMDREGWPELRDRFAGVFATRSRAEWEETFAGVDACVAGVYTMSEAPSHPHLRERGTFVVTDGVAQPAAAPRFASTPPGRPGPIPRAGEHSQEVLASLGPQRTEISRLSRESARPTEEQKMTDDAMVRREATEIDAVVAGQTIVDVFNRNAERHPDHAAIHWREGDEWHSLSWSEYRTRVRELAAGLQSLGVGAGDFTAIQSGNRPEHVMADMAAIHLGATGVTVYSTLAPQQVAYVARDCGASVAILENMTFMKTWEEIRPELNDLRYVVLMDGAENYPDSDWVLSWDEVIARGRERLAEDPGAVDTSGIEPDGLATLIYTSGTTGNPKGVMISHRNVMWTAESSRRALGVIDHPRLVSYLPLAHIAERLSSHYLGIYLAGEVWYCPDMTQVLDYVQQGRPTLFVGVPRVWEKFATRLNTRFEETGGLKGKLVERTIALGTKKVETEQAGGSLGGLDAVFHGLLDRVVLSKVREQLGMDAVTFAITAAAPITPDLITFFHALGIPVYEVYGLSENTGPATANTADALRIGSVGIPIPGVDVRIGDDGEVLISGGIVAAGYYNLPTETTETFSSDGWLHTGDLGRIDDDGFIHIVGRKKEILITASGKNVAPAKLETLLGNHPLVSKACVLGDGRNYLTMIVALDAEEAPLWAERHGLAYTDLAGFSHAPEVVSEIERAVEEANQHVARAEQVKKHLIVPDAWSPETGEVTPSLKLKRHVVLERYASEIDQLYAG